MLAYLSSLKIDYEKLKQIDNIYKTKFKKFFMSEECIENILIKAKENCVEKHYSQQTVPFEEIYKNILIELYNSYVREKIQDGTFLKIIDSSLIDAKKRKNKYCFETLIADLFSELDYTLTLEEATFLLNNSKCLIPLLTKHLNQNNLKSLKEKENISVLLESYFNAINYKKYNNESFTSQKQLDYLTRIKSGDKKAKDEFILINAQLIKSVISHLNIDLRYYEDAYQAGICGLIKAIDSFDCSKGFMFSTFAYPIIIREISKDLNSIIYDFYVPDYLQPIIRNFEKLPEGLTVQQVSNDLGINFETANLLMKRNPNALSLNTEVQNKISEVDSGSLEARIINDIIASDDDIEEEVTTKIYMHGLIEAIRKAIKYTTLEEDKKQILIRYYNLDGMGAKKLTTLAKDRDTTHETIRNRKKRALNYIGLEFKKDLLPYAENPKEAYEYLLSNKSKYKTFKKEKLKP